jgi:beta-lactam-binding protein with PASTA domain
MPDVTGDKLPAAQRKLEQKGIPDVSVSTRATNDEDSDGRVLSQSPSAGSRVSPGDPVSLVVGKLAGSSSTTSDTASPTN